MLVAGKSFSLNPALPGARLSAPATVMHQARIVLVQMTLRNSTGGGLVVNRLPAHIILIGGIMPSAAIMKSFSLREYTALCNTIGLPA